MTPLARYQRDLLRIRSLGAKAAQLDALFHHRSLASCARTARCRIWASCFEVPYELSGKTVRLVVDPHAQRVVGVENEAGESLGEATPLDAIANAQAPTAQARGGAAHGYKHPRSAAPTSWRLRPCAVPRREQGGLTMHLQHFGLRTPRWARSSPNPGMTARWRILAQRFDWLLQSPGIGLLTGEPGVGKTAALRKLTRTLNPHRYLVLYLAETDFGRVDIYRGLARALGVEPSYRRAQLWRDIKQRVHELVDSKQVTPRMDHRRGAEPAGRLLPRLPRVPELRLRFARPDQRLDGGPSRSGAHPRARAVRGAGQPHPGARGSEARGRARALRAAHRPCLEERRLPAHACSPTPAWRSLRQASKGLPRQAGRILCTAMRLAVPKGLNHLPDELLQQAIAELQ